MGSMQEGSAQGEIRVQIDPPNCGIMYQIATPLEIRAPQTKLRRACLGIVEIARSPAPPCKRPKPGLRQADPSNPMFI